MILKTKPQLYPHQEQFVNGCSTHLRGYFRHYNRWCQALFSIGIIMQQIIVVSYECNTFHLPNSFKTLVIEIKQPSYKKNIRCKTTSSFIYNKIPPIKYILQTFQKWGTYFRKEDFKTMQMKPRLYVLCLNGSNKISSL